jgi:hypothetical protein
MGGRHGEVAATAPVPARLPSSTVWISRRSAAPRPGLRRRFCFSDPNGRGGQGMHKDALNLPAPCYWRCSGRLKLSDNQVLLVLRWPSQAVRRPGVTGVALAVSSCPTTRCYWCCAGRLKLSDDQVLLVLRWPSQAVRRPGCYWCCAGRLKLSDDQVLLVLRWPSQAVRGPGTAGTAVSVSYCLTARYCWYCCIRLLLLDGQVLLVLLYPSPTA